MKHGTRCLILSAALLLSGLRAGQAQPTPVGPAHAANVTKKGQQRGPSVAADTAGRFAVVWTDKCSNRPDDPVFPCADPSPDGNSTGVFGRWYDAAGEPVASEVQLNAVTEGRQELPDVTVGADGRFFVVWGSEGRIVGRLFDEAGTPLGPELPVSEETAASQSQAPSVAPLTPAGYVVAWRRSPGGDLPQEVWARQLDAAGHPLDAPVRADGGGAVISNGPDVAAAADGSFAVTWQTSPTGGDPNDWRIRARLFSRAGAPLGSELLVDEKKLSLLIPLSSAVAALPEGGFLLAWDADIRRTHDIFARTLRAVGAQARLGEIVQVSQGGYNMQVELARDPRGGFLAVWSHTDAVHPGWSLAGRRLDARGRPFGAVVNFVSDPLWNLSDVNLAATPAGFVLAWTFGYGEGPGPDGEASSVYLRRYIISAPGADLCAFSAGGFGCDLLRDGGADLVLGFGAPSDRPLLADFDGDGRDDPCAFRSGRFLCDTSHDGSPDVDLAYQPEAGAPLLGDLNGDGRADPCVRAGRRFLCDTAHNGGTAEQIVAFGRLAGDVPLLGNLDGDRDDDPCLYRGGQLHCDLSHDGGEPELILTFGGGGVPLLGDMDGDGRDEICLARDGRLRCDTGHDGGGAELDVPFDPAGGEPLLGNVDGY